MKQTHIPSVCRELTSSAEACNNGSGRRRHHPNVDLRSHSLARYASTLGPLAENSSQINSATNDNISDLVDDIVTCGYTGLVSIEKRDSMIRTVILHSTMRVLPMLDQLRKGLQLYDLPKVMKSHQDLCQKLFIPGEDDEADAAFLLESSCPVYSEIGSAKHQKELNIMSLLQDFLQECFSQDRNMRAPATAALLQKA
ncbi:uncharacterized protein LOC125905490 isoform X3 [Epinephelus fuscoguttatus]|uniref:uncharacterized protein LOC125905490 isoform X3 n=1 Tax=Epinephelus fuscoguttatus TaxID=293821 RepID=UPI0020D1B0ED|nr:uncharacterized protein LOC125905490 isoform X3 [Epinephelus fuscoguttatus]